jgi:hypothetical protein
MKNPFFKNQLGYLLIIMVLLLIVTSCAHNEAIAPCLKGHQYGFWAGLWHGIIAPIDFVGMLIYDDITLYATNNNGAWYAFGFLIGSGGWGFFGGKGVSKFRKKQAL